MLLKFSSVTLKLHTKTENHKSEKSKGDGGKECIPAKIKNLTVIIKDATFHNTIGNSGQGGKSDYRQNGNQLFLKREKLIFKSYFLCAVMKPDKILENDIAHTNNGSGVLQEQGNRQVNK